MIKMKCPIGGAELVPNVRDTTYHYKGGYERSLPAYLKLPKNVAARALFKGGT
jgi:hypothetical protein